MFCAANIDGHTGNDIETITRGLERARDTGEVIQLYGHEPGAEAPLETIEAILARATDLGLRFFKSSELTADGAHVAGLALSFDDADVAEWWGLRDMLDRYGANVTFFVTRYHEFDEVMKAQLRDLASDGHAIEAHSVNHLRAPEYVSEHGLRAYVTDEALPSIDRLRADGYDVTDYAYPFGSRTGELDHAMLEHVDRLRSVVFPFDGPILTDPCPE
jgi:peptidoglycan/xylan/chitin deacetylase (PgdA/CDA1 family)